MEDTTRRALAASLVAAFALAAGAARADEERDARAAYDAGAAAHARGDFREAARDFARADALAPNSVALKAALDEAVLAGDAELAMTLVERGRARGAAASMQASVQAATSRFAGRTGRVRIDCGAARDCRAAIDGRPIDARAVAVVLAGAHRVAIDADGRAIAEAIVVQGDREVDLVVPAAPPVPIAAPQRILVPVVVAPPQPASSASAPAAHDEPASRAAGLSPVWFAGAAIATGVAGGLAIASGIDTASKHSTFADRCAQAGDPACPALSNDGSSAQLRTNVLLAATGALGAATITLAFFTRWHTGGSVALLVAPRGGAVRVAF